MSTASIRLQLENTLKHFLRLPLCPSPPSPQRVSNFCAYLEAVHLDVELVPDALHVAVDDENPHQADAYRKAAKGDRAVCRGMQSHFSARRRRLDAFYRSETNLLVLHDASLTHYREKDLERFFLADAESGAVLPRSSINGAEKFSVFSFGFVPQL